VKDARSSADAWAGSGRRGTFDPRRVRRFKQLQRDRRFFFEVFYKTKARVHADTTEQSIFASDSGTIETTEIAAAIQRFLFATGENPRGC
jgi:hypothetical protein